MSFSASYFDGKQVRGETVEAEFDSNGALHLHGSAAPMAFGPKEYAFAAALGRVPRFARLAGDMWLEVPWSPSAESEIARWSRTRSTRAVRLIENNPVLAGFAAVCAVAAVAVAAFTAIPRLARRLAFSVPVPVEQAIGRASEAAALRFAANSNLSWEDEERVQSQLERLLAVRHLHVHPQLVFVSMAQPNAFALPGGPIVITDQLVTLGLTDNEIAAVLAHELGHQELRHGLQNILSQSTALIVVSIVTGDLSALTHYSGALPALILTRGYSREFERQADAFGVGLLADAHIDPNALASALLKIEAASGGNRIAGGYLSTHPSTPERVKAIRTEADKAFAAARQQRGKIMSDALAAYRRKDFSHAVECFKVAFQISPPDGPALYDAGCAAALSHDRSDASRWLHDAAVTGHMNIAIFPRDPALNSMFGTKDWTDLLILCRDDDLPMAMAYVLRAKARAARGDSNDAEIDRQEAVSLQTKALADLVLKGVADARAQHFQAAVDDFSRAIAMAPDDAMLAMERAIANYNNHAYRAAAADFTRYIDRFPDDGASYFERALCRFSYGDIDGAREDLDQTEKLSAGMLGYVRPFRGYCDMAWGDFPAARDDLEAAIRTGSGDRAYNEFNLFLVLWRLNGNDDANPLALQVSKLSQGWPRDIGQFLLGETSEEEFLQQAEEADDYPTIRQHECEALYYAGEVRLLQGDAPGARPLFERCISTGESGFHEYQMALSELARMPQPTAAHSFP